jgi:hypothetical protein
VLEQIAQAGDDEAAVASVVRGWAERHPYIQLTGGTGVSHPSILMSADSGRAQSRYRGMLALYASPQGESPMLEIRVKRMCRTPPYRRAEMRERLLADPKALGIPRLDTEDALAGKRPNIPLSQPTGGRAERLLSLVDQWIDDIRAHATEPEPTGES